MVVTGVPQVRFGADGPRVEPVAHRDDREATRARADAAARDLEDARRDLERLAPETDRLARENEALRSKLARLSPPEVLAVGDVVGQRKPARNNLVLMSISLGALVTLLVAGLMIAALITRGALAPASSDATAPTRAAMAEPVDSVSPAE